MKAKVKFEIKCKNMLYSFLNNCKENRPDIAVITPNGLIKDKFYLDLSEYVGKIILNKILKKINKENKKNEL